MDRQLVEDLNFRVISKKITNLQKIIVTIPFAVLAKYDTVTKMWVYLKFKGPLFLVEDKLSKKKIVILNQCESGEDYIAPISENQYHFELKNLGESGYLFNIGSQDSTNKWAIWGIWTQSENIKSIYNCLSEQSITK